MTERFHGIALAVDKHGAAIDVLDVFPLGLDAVAEERKVKLHVAERNVAVNKVEDRPELLGRADRPKMPEPILVLLLRHMVSRIRLARLLDQPQHPLVAEGVSLSISRGSC